MRQIKREKGTTGFTDVNLNYMIICPLDNLGTSNQRCVSNCAWFHIEEEYTADLTNQIKIKKAYCKDHCIGEVIE